MTPPPPPRRLPRLLPLAVLLPLALPAVGLRYSFTGSAPRGFYIVINDPPARGTYVSACLPVPLAHQGLANHYLTPGSCPGSRTQPILKQVAAVPGDLVTVAAHAVFVNQHAIPRSARLSVDRARHPITALPLGSYTVAPETLWLLATADPRSWDSRYYGAVPFLAIRETLRPILTW